MKKSVLLAAAAVSVVTLPACGSSKKTSGGAAPAPSSSASASGSAKASPSVSADAPPVRLDGQYRVVSTRAGSGLLVNFRPTCPSGPCTTNIDYQTANGGADGKGSATWDGKGYTATIKETYGCQIGGVITDPAAEGTVTMKITIDSARKSALRGVADIFTGSWSGQYQLVGKGVGHPGCLAPFPAERFVASLHGPAA